VNNLWRSRLAFSPIAGGGRGGWMVVDNSVENAVKLWTNVWIQRIQSCLAARMSLSFSSRVCRRLTGSSTPSTATT
jgi:hypothetical protein